jgi:hypothetical protein
VTEGGLNLFKLHDFALALQCSWVKRTVSLQHDNWRHRLFNISSAGIFNISRCEISGLGPVLKGICENYIDFRERYGTVKNNFLSVPIFDNKYFFYKQGRERMHYDATFFQVQEGTVPETAVLKLKWGDMCDNNGNLMATDDLAMGLGFELDLEKLRLLAKGYHSARKKYFTEKDPILPVDDFFSKFKKGSRAFRNVLSRSKLIPKLKHCPIHKFAETVYTNCPEPEVIRKINARWCAQYYLVDIKTFLFKFYHNTLSVNARVAHFNPERSPACFFCEKKIILPAPRETMSHFFWDCQITHSAVITLCNKIITVVVDKNLFFYSTDDSGRFSIQL